MINTYTTYISVAVIVSVFRFSFQFRGGGLYSDFLMSLSIVNK